MGQRTSGRWAGSRLQRWGGFDTLELTRDLKSGLAVVFHGTYFATEHLGITGEAMLVGLGLEDQCKLLSSSGSVQNR